MGKYILVHDLGTTGNKTCIFNVDGRLKAKLYLPFKTYYPQSDYAEQGPQEWWRTISSATKKILISSKISPKEIICMTFSGHNPSCIPIDREGQLIYKHIPIYADLRAHNEVKNIIDRLGGYKRYYEITGGGQILEQYSLFKMMWMKENDPENFKSVFKFVNTLDYIIYKLTGNFVTSHSLASNTGLYDIRERKWSEIILDSAELSEKILSNIEESTFIAGKINKQVSKEIGLLSGTPIVIGGGDVPCAATGAGVVKKGIYYMNLGSAAWVGAYTDNPYFNQNLHLATLSHLKKNKYVLHLVMTGACICYQWLRDNVFNHEKSIARKMKISAYELMDLRAKKIRPGSDQLIFLPYIRGVWSGNFNPSARAAYIGLDLIHNKSHFIRAALEGIGFALRDLLEMLGNGKIDANEIRIIGGGAKSKLWRQIIADITGINVKCPLYTQEASSLGAAISAGVSMGVFNDFDVVLNFNKIVDTRYPRKSIHEKYNKLYPVFKNAYKNINSTFEDLRNVDL